MIYYSHVNEDSRPEQMMLASGSYSRLVAVAGSGERVISLLNGEALTEIDIVDPNAEALFLTEIKITALRLFSATDYLFFTGFYQAGDCFERREDMLSVVMEELSGECADYWGGNQTLITSGRLLFCGHFEIFITRVQSIIKRLFGAKITTMLNTPFSEWGGYERRVWKVLKEIFKYRISYRLMGNRDPAFIQKGADSPLVGQALQELFGKNEQSNSFFVHLLFKGHLRDMPREALPDSLSEGFLSDAKNKLDHNKAEIKYHRTDLRTFLRGEKELGEAFISASDLLSFESPEYMVELMALLISNRQNGPNQLVWRSFLKHREWNSRLNEQQALVIKDISRYERTLMYRVYSAVI